jgi:hypothetical protein
MAFGRIWQHSKYSYVLLRGLAGCGVAGALPPSISCFRLYAYRVNPTFKTRS